MKLKMSYEKRKNMYGYIFLSPWLFASIFLLYIPLIFSLMLSFTKLLNVTSYSMQFVGLDNFKKAFLEDVDFVPMFLTTIQDTFRNTPMILVFSLLIAIIISKKIKFQGFFRSVFFFPVLLGTGFIMQQLLGQKVDQSAIEVARGILLPPQIQSYIGADASKYITDFLNSITLVMWKSGVQIIIALAGIQKIPSSIYESAKVDSASEWEIFWKITLPLLTPVLLLNTIYTIINSFTDSENGMVKYIIKVAFNDSDLNYAAAMGWVYFLFAFLLIGIVFLILKPFIKNVT